MAIIICWLFSGMEMSINTPALLFPAITLMMLAYTNRFLALAGLVRKLHDEFQHEKNNTLIKKQIRNLRSRLSLIRSMQALSVLSFVLSVFCMYLIVNNHQPFAHIIFAISLLCLLSSLIISLIEIYKSTHALDLELSDMEMKGENIIEVFLKPEED